MAHFTKGLILAVDNVPTETTVNELKEFGIDIEFIDM